MTTHSFDATLDIIGVNPFVFVPPTILAALLTEAGKDKGPLPVCCTLNGVAYAQTLVKYAGEWRLYIIGTTNADRTGWRWGGRNVCHEKSKTKKVI